MKKILILTIVLFGIYNLKSQNTGTLVKLPKTGGEFELLKKGDGQVGKESDFIQLSYLVSGDDGSLLADRRDSSSWATDQIRPLDSLATPLVEMLHFVSKGDSIRFVQKFEPDKKPRGLEKFNSITYVLKIENILDQATMEKRNAEEQVKRNKIMEEMKKRETEVGSQVTDLLGRYKSGQLAPKLLKSGSGLEYYIVEKGNSKKVVSGEKVSVNYYGAFIDDGKMFDNSFSRGQALSFTAGAGQMIKGWDEAMLLLNHGDKAILFIPYQLAYGEAGRPPQIPEKSNLSFYIEIQ